MNTIVFHQLIQAPVGSVSAHVALHFKVFAHAIGQRCEVFPLEDLQ